MRSAGETGTGDGSLCLCTYSFLLLCVLSLVQQEVYVTRGEMVCHALLVTSSLMKLMSYGAEWYFLLTLQSTDAVYADSSSRSSSLDYSSLCEGLRRASLSILMLA